MQEKPAYKVTTAGYRRSGILPGIKRIFPVDFKKGVLIN
jgi:hypothetical protein